MTLDEVKSVLVENGFDDAVVFTDPDYADAFLGASDEGRAVYDYMKMVDCLMAEDDMTREDAIDFIEYNTMRALPYMGQNRPIIILP